MEVRKFLFSIILALMSLVLVPVSGAFAGTDGNTPPPELLTVTVSATAGSGMAQSVTPLEGIAADSGILSCYRTDTVWIAGTQDFGITVWRYNKVVSFCDDDSGNITNVSVTTWGEVFALWQYAGDWLNYESGGVGSSFYQSRHQAHFQLCLPAGCFQHVYPWIEVTVIAGGSYTWMVGT